MNDQQQKDESAREADAELARIVRLEKSLRDACADSIDAMTPGGFHPRQPLPWSAFAVVAVGCLIAWALVAAVTP